MSAYSNITALSDLPRSLRALVPSSSSTPSLVASPMVPAAAPANLLASGLVAPGRVVRPAIQGLRTKWEERSARQRSERLERAMHRAGSRGRPVFVGSVEHPYDPATLARAPWSALEPYQGLAVRLTTRSAAVARELPVLAELDQSHAIAVDLVVGSRDRGLLSIAGDLAAEGLTTRLILQPDREGHLAPAGLRRLFAAARRAGVFDVRLAERDADGRRVSPRVEKSVRCLRLEHGFPHSNPGRG